MNQLFQDAMAIARFYGGFDLFITLTTNPAWPEITNALFPGQTAADRPDLIARVFNMYKSPLIHDVTKGKIFGNVLAYAYSIEFQKRGLPHVHLLLTLQPRFQPVSPDQVDTLICASWPNKQHHPLLFDIVKCCMVHGPCGSDNPTSPCMIDGKCSKHYPKTFQEETTMNANGYPNYARPNNSCQVTVRNIP